MSKSMTVSAALLLVSGALPLSAQAVRVDATVRLAPGIVAGVTYGPRHYHAGPAPVVVVRSAPVVIVARPAPVVVYRVHGHRNHRAHVRLHRELGRRHERWYRSHAPGLRAVRYDDDHDDDHDD